MPKDMVGLRFGLLTVVSQAPTRNGYAMWNTLCDCGTQTTVTGASLRSGGSLSCGCSWKTRWNAPTGKVFGSLTVLGDAEGRDHGSRIWKVRCVCGAEFTTRGSKVRRGEKTSCGCQTPQWKKHGKKIHPLYSIWLQMRARCRNPRHKSYQNYGGRGITICERWDDFELFLADVGERPPGRYSIDRIDNDGNYEPGNVRWATATEQIRNRRRPNPASYPRNAPGRR